jgi:hypothetical protein
VINDSLHRKSWMPSSQDDFRLVSFALEEILSSQPFRGSRRYPAMLRYIVEKTIDNHQSELKERTIGVEVFGRDPTYDTNADPVVRFSAGEIRRRLAQFYLESGTASPLVMELPPGTYVPRFSMRTPPLTELAEPAPAPTPALVPQPEPETKPNDLSPAPLSSRSVRLHWSVYLFAVLVLAGIACFLVLHWMPSSDPVTEVWAPVLRNPDPVLISAGRPVPEAGDQPVSPDISIGDHILLPEFRVSIATLDAIANMVGYLKSRQKPFRIHEANSNTLADLHNRPVVLVTGNNNKWTVLLMKDLRFHFVQQGQYSYIEDAKNPGFHGWSVDFTQPLRKQTTDYAVVARFNSPTTGGPVLVVAGISSNGTEAAGEFIVSPEALARLEKAAPPGGLNHNFEAVLKVEVVDGNTGSATVVASQFW